MAERMSVQHEDAVMFHRANNVSCKEKVESEGCFCNTKPNVAQNLINLTMQNI